MTFGEYWPDYIRSKELFVKKSTICAYKNIWIVHLRERFQYVDMDTVKPSMIQNFVNESLLEGRAVHTVNDHVVVIKNMMALYYESTDRYAPVFKIRWPSKSSRPEKEMRPFTDAELKKMFADIRSGGCDSRKWAFAIMLTTGVRIGELCGIRFSDFDYKNHSIHIQRTVERIYDMETKHTEMIVSPPKTLSSDRFVYPPKWVLDFWKVLSNLCNPDDYLVSGTSKGDRPFEPRTLRCFFKSWLEGLKIPYRNPHQCRHTVATRLIEKGVDIRTAAAILGHANATTTLDTYAHTSEDRKKKATRKIDIVPDIE